MLWNGEMSTEAGGCWEGYIDSGGGVYRGCFPFFFIEVKNSNTGGTQGEHGPKDVIPKSRNSEKGNLKILSLICCSLPRLESLSAPNSNGTVNNKIKLKIHNHVTYN